MFLYLGMCVEKHVYLLIIMLLNDSVEGIEQVIHKQVITFMCIYDAFYKMLVAYELNMKRSSN